MNSHHKQNKGGISEHARQSRQRIQIFKRFISLFTCMVLIYTLLFPLSSIEANAATKGTIKSVTVTNIPYKTLTMAKGKTFRMKVSVKKTGTISSAVKYSTSNKKVVTVSSTGKLTAKKKGSAKITITSKANKSKKVVINVKVGKPVTKVKLNKTKASVKIGKKVTLKTTISPSNATNKSIKWISSNTKVATVSSKGVVKGIKTGIAKITATAKDGSGKKAVCTVKVGTLITSIKLNSTNLTMFRGKPQTLKATIAPSGATNKTLKWTSSNTAVATVTSKGVVTPKKAGTTKITAAATDGSGKKAVCNVKVVVPVTSVSLNPSSASVEVGESIQVKASVQPSDATDKGITWSSNNPNVAVVDETGTINGITYGTAVITAKATNGKKASITVSVSDDPATSVILTATTKELVATGDNEKIYFYAQVNGRVSSVNLLNDAESVIAEMIDDGQYSLSGDDIPNDHIFSCVIDSEFTAGVYTYYAEAYTDDGRIQSIMYQITVVDELSDEMLQKIEQVDTNLEELQEEISGMSDSEKEAETTKKLEELQEENLINQVDYDFEAGVYTFEYSNGVLGGVMIKDFDDQVNGEEALDDPADFEEAVVSSNAEEAVEEETEQDEADDAQAEDGATEEIASEEVEEPISAEVEESVSEEETADEPTDDGVAEEIASEEVEEPVSEEVEESVSEEVEESVSEEETADEPADDGAESGTDLEEDDAAVITEEIAEDAQDSNTAEMSEVLSTEDDEKADFEEASDDEVIQKEAQTEAKEETKSRDPKASGLWETLIEEDFDYSQMKNSDFETNIGDAIIYYGFGHDSNESWRYPFYENLESEWEGKGLNTTLVYNATVDDFRSIGAYDVAVISMHGSTYSGSPVICTREASTEDRDQHYNIELVNRRVARVTTQTGTFYWVMPSFFSESVGGNAFDGAIIFSECCQFMGRFGIDNFSMPNTMINIGADVVVGFHNSVLAYYCRDFMKNFVDRMIEGDTSQEAFNSSRNTYGSTDGQATNAAHAVLRGKTDKRLVETGIENGSFEEGITPVKWNSTGDVRIITGLASLTPREAKQMAILTTGVGSKESQYLAGTEGSILEQKFVVPSDANNLHFTYDVVSEEPTEYVGSSFDDKFYARLLDSNGNVIKVMASETVNTSTWYSIANINFEGGDDTVYHTKWKTINSSLSAYRGKTVTLQFMVYDVGDSIYDTVGLVDKIYID